MSRSARPANKYEDRKNGLQLNPLGPQDQWEFRIKPRRPPAAAEPRIAVPQSLARIYSYARQTARVVSRTTHSSPPYYQRCAVRVTYVGNRAPGQWKAHGRYLSRESATHRTAQRETGFDEARQKLDAARSLNDWQQAGDPRLWKIIVSPEFGEQLSIYQLGRAVMEGVEQELGASVEWVAVAHYNTGHPRVHIAMRGIDRRGREIRLTREFIQHGIRKIAENWCTEQLGYRTRAQAIEAQRREVSQIRYTSLDRIIMRANTTLADGTHFPVTCGAGGRAQFVVARLAVLEGMGLAHRVSADTWEVRRDLESVLREMQKIADRQRTLSASGVLRSDERLPIVAVDCRSLDYAEGRILVHSEEENGRSYMMLESTDGRVYAINHTRRMQEMRHAGSLRANTFIRLRRIFVAGRWRNEIEDLGTAESILKNRGYLVQTAQQLVRKGAIPEQQGWGGWLGRYHQAVDRTADELQRKNPDLGKGR